MLWLLQVPRVDLAEMGPRVDLAIRRRRDAPPDLAKEALQRAKTSGKKARPALRIPAAGTFLFPQLLAREVASAMLLCFLRHFALPIF